MPTAVSVFRTRRPNRPTRRRMPPVFCVTSCRVTAFAFVALVPGLVGRTTAAACAPSRPPVPLSLAATTPLWSHNRTIRPRGRYGIHRRRLPRATVTDRDRRSSEWARWRGRECWSGPRRSVSLATAGAAVALEVQSCLAPRAGEGAFRPRLRTCHGAWTPSSRRPASGGGPRSDPGPGPCRRCASAPRPRRGCREGRPVASHRRRRSPRSRNSGRASSSRLHSTLSALVKGRRPCCLRWRPGARARGRDHVPVRETTRPPPK